MTAPPFLRDEEQCRDCGRVVPFYCLPLFDGGRWVQGMGAAHFCAHGCTGDHKPVALPSARSSLGA